LKRDESARQAHPIAPIGALHLSAPAVSGRVLVKTYERGLQAVFPRQFQPIHRMVLCVQILRSAFREVSYAETLTQCSTGLNLGPFGSVTRCSLRVKNAS